MDDDSEVKCPYEVGTILTLRTEGERGLAVDEDQAIRCRIVKLFEPFTQSCVMEVKILGVKNQNSRAVLKLFDHRFATQVRKKEGLGPLTIAQEKEFSDFVTSGSASVFLDRLRSYYYAEREEGWNAGQNEVYLSDWFNELFETEVKVYRQLQELQGQEVPVLIAQVRLETCSPYDEIESSELESTEELFEVPGLLLELIEGYTLLDMEKIAPREDWGRICDQVIQVVQLLDDFDVRNHDVREANIVISPILSESKYRVVMLDFGHCVLREPGESSAAWNRAKWAQDEEGAIGLAMQNCLKEKGYDWPFVHSYKFLEWAPGEDNFS